MLWAVGGTGKTWREPTHTHTHKRPKSTTAQLCPPYAPLKLASVYIFHGLMYKTNKRHRDIHSKVNEVTAPPSRLYCASAFFSLTRLDAKQWMTTTVSLLVHMSNDNQCCTFVFIRVAGCNYEFQLASIGANITLKKRKYIRIKTTDNTQQLWNAKLTLLVSSARPASL